MSVVVWDGKYLAADQQATSGQLICKCIKLHKVRGYAVGFVGREDTGLLLLEWFKAGCKAEEWLGEVQQSEDGAILVVAGKNKAWEVAEYPIFAEVRDPFWAWGTGREVALGAMAMGVDAKTAVETAMRFDVSCGVGIDFFECKGLTAKIARVK